MTGLIRPIKGTIKVDGQNIADVDQDDWRSKIGYLPQEPYFFNLTLRQNLSLDQSLSDEKIWMALEQAGAYEFVIKLSNKLNTNVGEEDVLFRWAKAKVILGQGYIEGTKASHFRRSYLWA